MPFDLKLIFFILQLFILFAPIFTIEMKQKIQNILKIAVRDYLISYFLLIC